MTGAGPERRCRTFRHALIGLLIGLPLVLTGPRPAEAAAENGQQSFLLIADTLTQDEAKGLVIARGHVQIDSGQRRLLADEVTYDPTTDRVMARGHVALTDENGDTYFGDEVELQQDLREGFVSGVRLLRADDSRAAGNRAVRSGGRYTELDKAVYSPCPLCAESGDPLWQIKARKVIHDQQARTVTYRDAVLEFFGVPVFYTPYLTHPDPTVKRETGFLTPSFGSRSEIGLFTEVPYFWNLAPNRDLTFSPIFTQSGGTVLGGEYRELREIGRTELAGSLTYTDAYARDPDKSDGQDVRGHIRGKGRYPLAEDGEAGFDVFLASDNSYLKRYGFSSDSRLENRAYVERYPDRDFMALNGYFFQGLRETDNQHRIPIVLPLAVSRQISEPLIWGSHWTLDSSLLALTRIDGLDTRRLSTQAGWEVPFVGPIGDLYRLETSLRGDFYYTEGNPETFSSTGGAGQEARLIPRATADWSWPLVGSSGVWTYQVEPVAMLTLAPTDSNSNKIPNEDSRDFEFDETNLFEPDRFPGLDRVDATGNLAYGFRFSGFGPGALQISGLLGQNVRLYGSSPFPEDSGLDERLSDYVGRLDLRPTSWGDLSFRFRFNPDGAELRRSDLAVTVGPSWLRFSLDYLNLSREPEVGNEEGFASREEIVLGARTQITDRLALAAQTRRDLTRDAPVAHQFGLLYTHPCLTLLAGVERSFTSTGELNDETTVLVRIALKNLGEIQTGSFLGL